MTHVSFTYEAAAYIWLTFIDWREAVHLKKKKELREEEADTESFRRQSKP